MNNKIAASFREFILGSLLNFSTRDTLIDNLKQQLASCTRFDLFVIFVLLACLLCFIAGFFTIVNLSGLFKSCVLAILIVYCFFCIQKFYQIESNLYAKKDENKTFELQNYNLFERKISHLLDITRNNDESKHMLHDNIKNKKQNITNDTVENSKDNYINKLKNQMVNIDKTENDYIKFAQKIVEQQKQIRKSFSELKDAYYEFSKNGKKIKNELLAIDISVELYDYEFKKLEEQIDKLNSIQTDNVEVKDNAAQKLLQVHKTTKKNESDFDEDSNMDDTMIPHNINLNIENEPTKDELMQKWHIPHKKSALNLQNFSSKFFAPDLYNSFSLSNNSQSNKEQKTNVNTQYFSDDKNIQDIKKYIYIAKITYFLESFVVFVAILLLSLGFFGLFVTCKFILVAFLVANIIYSLFFMIEAQIIQKKCLLNDAFGCKNSKNTDYSDFTDEVIKIMKIENRQANPIQTIIKEFKRHNKDFVHKQSILKMYLKNKYDVNIQRSIDILKTLYSKLIFIEDDFDSLMSNKVRKEPFYDDIKTIMNQTYKIEKIATNDEIKMAIDLLQRYTELAWYTKIESLEFENTTNLFVIENQKKNKKDNEKRCKISLEKTCKIADDFNVLYFTMLFCGLLLLIFVSL